MRLLRETLGLTVMWALIAAVLVAGYAISAPHAGTHRLDNRPLPSHQQVQPPRGTP